MKPSNEFALGADQIQALEERRRRRLRQRLTAWGAFLLLGLLLGAIYATGFAETKGKDGTLAEPADVNNSPAANQDTSELAGKVTAVTSELSYSWAGRWGSIATAAMYQLDLSSFTSGDKFFSEVVLTNTPSGFSDLQLQLRVAKLALETETCAVAGVAALESSAAGGGAVSTNKRVMVFDTADAQVTFSGMEGATTGLLGDARYCVGIVNYAGPPAAGKDTGGTFLRKSTAGSSFSGTYPSFVATLNRMT